MSSELAVPEPQALAQAQQQLTPESFQASICTALQTTFTSCVQSCVQTLGQTLGQIIVAGNQRTDAILQAIATDTRAASAKAEQALGLATGMQSTFDAFMARQDSRFAQPQPLQMPPHAQGLGFVTELAAPLPHPLQHLFAQVPGGQPPAAQPLPVDLITTPAPAVQPEPMAVDPLDAQIASLQAQVQTAQAEQGTFLLSHLLAQHTTSLQLS